MPKVPTAMPRPTPKKKATGKNPIKKRLSAYDELYGRTKKKGK